MELCLITPAAHCDRTKLLPGRFCLANVEDEGYREMFAAYAKNGYDVVLDNGVFEDDPIDIEKYFKVIRQIRPRVVVAPDLMNANAEVNLQHALAFVAAAKDECTIPELMFVPQCERDDPQGYKMAIMNAIESKQFQWLGICRNGCNNAFNRFTHTTDESLNKFFFGAWAERLGILERVREMGVRFHLLGIGGDLNLLQNLWWVDRADTASLFFQATLGELVNKNGTLSENVNRPADYFRRDFGPSHDWLPHLKHNCTSALAYASKAARLKHIILKDRI